MSKQVQIRRGVQLKKSAILTTEALDELFRTHFSTLDASDKKQLLTAVSNIVTNFESQTQSNRILFNLITLLILKTSLLTEEVRRLRGR